MTLDQLEVIALLIAVFGAMFGLSLWRHRKINAKIKDVETKIDKLHDSASVLRDSVREHKRKP